MSDAFNEFDDRLRRIDKSRARLKNGYVTVVDRDGLIVVRPKRRRASFPWRGLVFLICGFLGFKALLMASMGFGNYQDRVAKLHEGGLVEVAGGYLMQPDPVSEYLAIQMRPYLK
ncbi:MAG: hypothetical protein VX083_01170 [Pseudomonadota bacterium]|jgi:hypothetical protein|uniref:hypothetical protein n=1 Tax=Thalassovita sp. TaxID=1979401 RepID=UPI002AAF63E6|nr:hypothetical protein [Thalassovita sp.]MEC7963664.1 hypothetical protein [Pseudomonadota bacterium]MEC8041533.1 hypothetical protein [Pseudomonadota bacterium]MEC8292078.1 hypothetical protein [Pseudomonadota bacterium]